MVSSAHGYSAFGSLLIHQAPRPGFSWLAYAAACAVGTLTGGLVLVLGPLVWEVVAVGPDALLRAGHPLEALRGLLLLTLGASALLIPVAMLVLAPVALPLLATLHRRGPVGAWAAVLGGTGCAAVGALLAALVGIDAPLVPPELDPAPLVAGTVLALALVAIPGALAGLTYRAVARRRGRL